MELTRELWNQALQLNQEIQETGKQLHYSDLMKHLGLSPYLSKCLLYSLKYRSIIIPRGVEMPSNDRPFKRIFLGGDTHCGHIAGLTPPTYQLNEDHPKLCGFAKFQKETWLWFYNEIERLKPFDVAIWNGDMIDGKGAKTGGTELLTSDRNIQVDMASEIIWKVGAKKNILTYGTSYHTGNEEDFEGSLADNIQAEAIKSELNLDINGVVLNVKHHIGGSSTPYGQGTPLLKDQLFQALRADQEERPKADIIVRSHVHEYLQTTNRNGTAIILPALQGSMTKYGQRRCIKIVDYGFAYVDIYPGREYYIIVRKMVPKSQVNEIIKL